MHFCHMVTVITASLKNLRDKGIMLSLTIEEKIFSGIIKQMCTEKVKFSIKSKTERVWKWPIVVYGIDYDWSKIFFSAK